MGFEIKHCDQLEWAENSMKMYSHSISIENYLEANILSSLQFLPEDKHLSKPQAYCLTVESGARCAWLNTYYLSTDVIRIRGLFVEKEYRAIGCMSYLLNGVLEKYKDSAKKVVSFSRKQSLAFHQKNGFALEHSFVPRTMVLYDPNNKMYYHDPENEIFLMCRHL